MNDSADTGVTNNQDSIAGFTASGTGVAVIRTLVLVYAGLASLQSVTLALLTMALV